jgi:pimeloyl-ACP methyl ester carboxylesterase
MCWNGVKRMVFGIFCLLTSFMSANDTPQRDECLYPPGQMVDVGGYKLHLYSTGSGGPAVIIDSGLGGMSSDWGLVQPEIAKFTQVVTYDRAGIAWSDSSPYPRTSQQSVQELHTLLENAYIPKPYILVGHSLGGNNVQLYAATYPNEVLGLVLVDSTHEEQEKSLPSHPIGDFIQSLLDLRLPLSNVTFPSPYALNTIVTQIYLASAMAVLPEEMQNTHLTMTTTKHWRAVLAEEESFLESLQQLANADRSIIRNKPCYVLSATGETDLTKFGVPEEEQTAVQAKQVVWQRAWNDLQDDLVSKFNGVHHIIAEKSNHQIHWNQPELIVQAVKELIEESKRL